VKTTYYILLLTIFFNFNLYGGSERLVHEMAYENSYNEALAKARKLDKPIMMVFTQEGCPYCYKFEEKTLTVESIDEEVKKYFLPLNVLRYKDKDKYPAELQPLGVPTVLFIDPKTQNVFYRSFGYKSKSEYKTELSKALEIFNKN